MKNKLSILSLFVILVSSALDAQDLVTLKTERNNVVSDKHEVNEKETLFKFNAYSLDSDLESISTEFAGASSFGEIIAKKCYLLDEKYTTQTALTPGDPATKTVVKKPVIYEAVKNIERELRRSVRKGTISLNAATNDLNKVLDVALNILSADTRDFENAIKSSRDINLKIDLFTNRVILNY